MIAVEELLMVPYFIEKIYICKNRFLLVIELEKGVNSYFLNNLLKITSKKLVFFFQQGGNATKKVTCLKDIKKTKIFSLLQLRL